MDFNCGIQIRISWISFFTVRLGNAKRNSLEQWSSFANYACACKTSVLFFKSFFEFPKQKQKTERKEIQEQISQRWNPFSDFAFDCKSEIRILKSKSRFPNRTHPKSLWRTRTLDGYATNSRLADTPLKRTAAKSPAKTNYRSLTEINCRCYRLSLIRALIWGPYSVRYKESWPYKIYFLLQIFSLP